MDTKLSLGVPGDRDHNEGARPHLKLAGRRPGAIRLIGHKPKALAHAIENEYPSIRERLFPRRASAHAAVISWICTAPDREAPNCD